MELNKLIDGISKSIYTVFGDDYEIYTSEVEQGLQEPCFLIICISPSQSKLSGNMYDRQQLIDVHYFPKDKINSSEEMNNVYDTLLEALEVIEVNGDLIRGSNMNAKTQSGVLHFFVEYNYHMIKETKKEYMEILDEEVEVKGVM